MALADTLADTVETIRSAVPAPIFDAIGRSIADLRASGQAARAVGTGAVIDLPVLSGLDARPLDLKALVGGRPVILIFYRGGWCPYCNVTLQAYAKIDADVRAAGGTIVAVTPELTDKAGTTAERNGVDFPIAVDRGNAFARSLGLVFALPGDLQPLYRQIGIDLAAHNGDESHELPIPAVYVLDKAGVVRWAFVEADFTQRPEPADALAALQSLT